MAEYKKFLKGSLSLATGVLSTADIQMPVQRGQGRGMNLGVVIHSISFSVDDATWYGLKNGNGKYVKVAFTKSTPAAIPELNTADLIELFDFILVEQTAAGMYVNDRIWRKDHSPPILIPNEKIVISAIENTAATGTLYYRIAYTIRSITQDELYSALNNQ